MGLKLKFTYLSLISLNLDLQEDKIISSITSVVRTNIRKKRFSSRPEIATPVLFLRRFRLFKSRIVSDCDQNQVISVKIDRTSEYILPQELLL